MALAGSQPLTAAARRDARDEVWDKAGADTWGDARDDVVDDAGADAWDDAGADAQDDAQDAGSGGIGTAGMAACANSGDRAE